MDLLKAMQISGSSLHTQRTVMNIISTNVANAQTTRTEEGGPYRRRIPVLSATTVPPTEFSRVLSNRLDKELAGVEVKEVQLDMSDLATRHDPNHPDADELGYVTLPNVNILEEMVHLMSAARNYEASVTAFNAAKSMILKALEIGR
ncbi:MAG: flagellar basal body rod protein FlgC [Deltaproteobacteria bacterium]|nr:flagellar basal body rod protein FlgC [Deltaproteobacteria bacterium]